MYAIRSYYEGLDDMHRLAVFAGDRGKLQPDEAGADDDDGAGGLEAREAGAFEVIMLNNREHICEGASSNIFCRITSYNVCYTKLLRSTASDDDL